MDRSDQGCSDCSDRGHLGPSVAWLRDTPSTTGQLHGDATRGSYSYALRDFNGRSHSHVPPGSHTGPFANSGSNGAGHAGAHHGARTN